MTYVVSGFSRTVVMVSGFSRTVVIVFALAASGLAAQTPVPEGNGENGKRLFAAYYCYACHGTMGQGGSAGARIAPRPIAFAAFQKYLRQPTGQMPPYRPSVVSDRELADIYAFLRSIPASASAKSIPLLNQ
jgi:mono/diheme cytochrome c family protein